MLPERRFATSSLSSENKLPQTRASEKLFFACKADILVNAGCSWPLTSPRTMLFQDVSSAIYSRQRFGEVGYRGYKW